MKIEFNPFDRIIVKRKDGIGNTILWTCCEFSHYDENYIATVGGNEYDSNLYEFLPYEGNSYLVGTSDMPDEYVELKEGDFVAVADDIEDIVRGYAYFRRFSAIISNAIYCKYTAHSHRVCDYSWKYCIPFSKFNPNDMEETRKHILCVKNGKLVKAVV